MNTCLIEDRKLIKCYQGKGKLVLEDIEEIKDFAFYNCDEIEEIYLPEGLITIGTSAFYGCSKLSKIVFPESVIYLGSSLFAHCTSLKEIILPNTLTRIPKGMFYRCLSLKEIHLPDTIRVIEHDAFKDCVSLEKMICPSHLKEIEDQAFLGCTSLKDVLFNEGLEKLGKGVFSKDKAFYHIKFPTSIKEIDVGAFETLHAMCFISNDSYRIHPKIFDQDYAYNAASKNKDKYLFEASYLPKVELNQWKPFARLSLLLSFFETYEKHQDKEMYLEYASMYKEELLKEMMTKSRYQALYQALDLSFYTLNEIEPYFDLIKDHEVKAKVMSYRQENSFIDELDDLFNDLF